MRTYNGCTVCEFTEERRKTLMSKVKVTSYILVVISYVIFYLVYTEYGEYHKIRSIFKRFHYWPLLLVPFLFSWCLFLYNAFSVTMLRSVMERPASRYSDRSCANNNGWVYVTTVFYFTMVTLVVIYLSWSLVISDSHANLSADLLDALHSYKDFSNVKNAIDGLQMRLQCCGRNTYKDWSTADWRLSGTSDAINLGGWLTGSELVPWSCCVSIDDLQCHNSTSQSEVKKEGCLEPLYYQLFTENVCVFSGMMLTCLTIQLYVTIATRYLQTSITSISKLALTSPNSTAPAWLCLCCTEELKHRTLDHENEATVEHGESGYDENVALSSAELGQPNVPCRKQHRRRYRNWNANASTTETSPCIGRRTANKCKNMRSCEQDTDSTSSNQESPSGAKSDDDSEKDGETSDVDRSEHPNKSSNAVIECLVNLKSTEKDDVTNIPCEEAKINEMCTIKTSPAQNEMIKLTSCSSSLVMQPTKKKCKHHESSPLLSAVNASEIIHTGWKNRMESKEQTTDVPPTVKRPAFFTIVPADMIKEVKLSPDIVEMTDKPKLKMPTTVNKKEQPTPQRRMTETDLIELRDCPNSSHNSNNGEVKQESKSPQKVSKGTQSVRHAKRHHRNISEQAAKVHTFSQTPEVSSPPELSTKTDSATLSQTTSESAVKETSVGCEKKTKRKKCPHQKVCSKRLGSQRVPAECQKEVTEDEKEMTIQRANTGPQSQTIIFKPSISIPTMNHYPIKTDPKPIPQPPTQTELISAPIVPPPPTASVSTQRDIPCTSVCQRPETQISSISCPQPIIIQSPPINVSQIHSPKEPAKNMAEALAERKGDYERKGARHRLHSSSSDDAYMKHKRRRMRLEKMKRKAQKGYCVSTSSESTDDEVHEAIWREINALGRKLVGQPAASSAGPPRQHINNKPAVINIRNAPVPIKTRRIRRRSNGKQLEERLQQMMRDELKNLRFLKNGTIDDEEYDSQSKPYVHFDIPPEQETSTGIKPILKKRRAKSQSRRIVKKEPLLDARIINSEDNSDTSDSNIHQLLNELLKETDDQDKLLTQLGVSNAESASKSAKLKKLLEILGQKDAKEDGENLSKGAKQAEQLQKLLTDEKKTKGESSKPAKEKLGQLVNQEKAEDPTKGSKFMKVLDALKEQTNSIPEDSAKRAKLAGLLKDMASQVMAEKTATTDKFKGLIEELKKKGDGSVKSEKFKNWVEELVGPIRGESSKPAQKFNALIDELMKQEQNDTKEEKLNRFKALADELVQHTGTKDHADKFKELIDELMNKGNRKPNAKDDHTFTAKTRDSLTLVQKKTQNESAKKDDKSGGKPKEQTENNLDPRSERSGKSGLHYAPLPSNVKVPHGTTAAYKIPSAPDAKKEENNTQTAAHESKSLPAKFQVSRKLMPEDTLTPGTQENNFKHQQPQTKLENKTHSEPAMMKANGALQPPSKSEGMNAQKTVTIKKSDESKSKVPSKTDEAKNSKDSAAFDPVVLDGSSGEVIKVVDGAIDSQYYQAIGKKAPEGFRKKIRGRSPLAINLKRKKKPRPQKMVDLEGTGFSPPSQRRLRNPDILRGPGGEKVVIFPKVIGTHQQRVHTVGHDSYGDVAPKHPIKKDAPRIGKEYRKQKIINHDLKQKQKLAPQWLTLPRHPAEYERPEILENPDCYYDEREREHYDEDEEDEFDRVERHGRRRRRYFNRHKRDKFDLPR